jgi:hypothetical protein
MAGPAPAGTATNPVLSPEVDVHVRVRVEEAVEVAIVQWSTRTT